MTKEKKEGLVYEFVKLLSEGKIPGYTMNDVQLVYDSDIMIIYRELTRFAPMYRFTKILVERFQGEKSE